MEFIMECYKKLELIIILVQLAFYHKKLYRQVKENNYKLIIFLLLQEATQQYHKSLEESFAGTQMIFLLWKNCQKVSLS